MDNEIGALADMPNEDELEEALLRAARGEFDRDLTNFLASENERLRVEILRLNIINAALNKLVDIYTAKEPAPSKPPAAKMVDRRCSCGDYCWGTNWACGPNGCYNRPA